MANLHTCFLPLTCAFKTVAISFLFATWQKLLFMGPWQFYFMGHGNFSLCITANLVHGPWQFSFFMDHGKFAFWAMENLIQTSWQFQLMYRDKFIPFFAMEILILDHGNCFACFIHKTM